MNLLNSFRSEWILLNRRRMWLAMGLTTVVFSVAATALTLSTAQSYVGDGDVGLALEAVIGSGGATAAVVFSIGFSSILVLAAFASSTGNDLTRGTLRAALTRQPKRWSLIAGKLAARFVVAAILMLGALVVGAATAAVWAPVEDISTAGWFDGSAMMAAAGDYVRLLGFVLVYALVGTTIAVLARSTPVALGIGLLWFGPIENVIGENRAWAERWFPGLVSRTLVQPDQPGALPMVTAVATLGVYSLVGVVVIATVMARRDVTG